MHEKWEEVNAMEPGPGLDRLIVEKVMKWTVYDGIPNEYVLPMYVDGMVTFESNPFEWSYFNPSAKINDAWSVVETMRHRGNEVNLWIYEPHRGIRCMIEDANHGPQFSFKGKTAPEAICKAALLAAMS
jgi:hypothetical protein